MKRVKYALTSLITSILLVSGTIYLTEQWRIFQPYMLFGSLISIIFIFLFFEQNFQADGELFVLASLLFVTCLIASLVNQDLYLLEGAVGLHFTYIALVMVYPSIIQKEDCNKLLAYSFLLFHIPLLTVPILIDGIEDIPYYGIFYNPNSLGSVAATSFIVILSRVSAMIDDFIFHRQINVGKIFLSSTFLIGILILILYSRSRTSFFTIIIISIIFLGMVLSRFISSGVIKLGGIIRGVFAAAIFGGLSISIILYTGIDEILGKTVVKKMEDSSGNVLSGRTQIWAKALEDRKYFGNGRDYFKSFSEGAHNTYISIMGQYGVIPTIIFILFVITIAYYSYIYIKCAYIDPYRYLPFYSIVSFIIFSLAEGMLFKASMLLVFCTAGVVSSHMK